MTSALARTSSGGWLCAPQTLDDVWKFAKTIADSDFAPKDFRGKPANVMVAIQMGAEVGLQPMASLQNIAVVNGRPSLWGDALLAIVMAHPSYRGHGEPFDEKTMTARCWIKREINGQLVTVDQTFSQADAQKAGLWGKQGPWQQHPKRMLKMRARGFAIRDIAADLIKGFITREEAQDIPVSIVRGTAEVVRASEALPAEASEPQREESSSGQVAAPKAPALPTRTSKNYAVKACADKPFTELSDGELGSYLSYYNEKLPSLTQANHIAAVEATIAAAEAELERRIQEEGQPLAADSTPEAGAVIEAADYDPETGEVLDYPPADDDLAPQLEKSVELAKAGLLYGDTKEEWGLSGADAPENRPAAKRAPRKGAA